MFLVLETSIVSSPCPLLPPECADEFLPMGCMQVPSQSAWIPMELNVAAYADGNGCIRSEDLKKALHSCVDEGERQHDETRWLEPQIEYDSWLNRRLAIALRGWGDLVLLRGDDPCDLTTLRELEALAEWVCKTLQSRSQQLAEKNSWCPALDAVGARVLRQRAASSWGPRWKKAVADVALRHRNLTTMSPWDVFPGTGAADLRYADLLPLTRFADAQSFHCNVSIKHWNANEFKGFYERVAALARLHSAAAQVATEV
jgi:hypothetical protein